MVEPNMFDMRFDSCFLLVENLPDALGWPSVPREWLTPDFLPVGDYVASSWRYARVQLLQSVHRIIAATLLTYAATTPCSRSNLGVAVELKLHCCPSGNGGLKTTECKVGWDQALTWGHFSRRGLEEELCLKADALPCVVVDEEKNEEEESNLLVAAALFKIDAGMALLVRVIGVALLCFYSGKRDMCICCLCFARGFTFF